MKFALVLFLIFTTFISSAQPLPEAMKRLCDSIAEYDCIARGGMDEDAVQYRRVDEFCAGLSNQQLGNLVEDKSPVLCCYAFQCLCCRKGADIFTPLLRHLGDKRQVALGCNFPPIRKESVSDFILNLISNPLAVSTNREYGYDYKLYTDDAYFDYKVYQLFLVLPY